MWLCTELSVHGMSGERLRLHELRLVNCELRVDHHWLLLVHHDWISCELLSKEDICLNGTIAGWVKLRHSPLHCWLFWLLHEIEEVLHIVLHGVLLLNGFILREIEF